MSVNQQVERMSSDQFQAWAQSQVRSVSGNRFHNTDPKSIQQCDNLLEEWGHHRQQIDQHEQALKRSVQVQRGLRQRLMSAIAKLQPSRTTAVRSEAKLALFQPNRKSPSTNARCAVPAPLTAPIVHVLAPSLGQHIITFKFSGPRGSQPAGSSGAEIFMAMGDECPVTDSGFRFAAWATRSPHLIQFNESDAGRMAHYRLRWINAKGETGPWSEVVSAEVPAIAELV